MYSGIFDSHAHYDDERFDADRETIISSLLQNGVVNVINIGCDLETSQKSVSLARQYPFFYAAVGYHPHEAARFNEVDFQRIEELLKQPKVVALGEIGLDYHYDLSPRQQQIEVFERQLRLAEALDIPIIIHTREATQDTLALLEKHRCRGVVHCYSGSPETAKVLIGMGYHIGFTGVVTFQNARKIVEACRVVPPERILLETDCPYMAPVPYRGKRCWSPMIEKTAERVAQIQGMPVQTLIDTARENTKRLFGVKG